MDKNSADPRLMWVASVLAAYVFIIYVTHA
jgi:hypothetical protein